MPTKKKTLKKKVKAVKSSEPRFFGFKVVQVKSKKLISCSVGKRIVHYVTDKWVGPRKFAGPLTLFRNMGRAIVFAEEKMAEKKNVIRVYRCEYVPTELNYVFRGLVAGMDMKSLSELPEGTILAQKVKISKRVF